MTTQGEKQIAFGVTPKKAIEDSKYILEKEYGFVPAKPDSTLDMIKGALK